MKALIMGGGMSGLCAACNLVDNGFEVTLLEATDMLGGRASSWLDADGDTIDNALHVFFPHYLNCISFMQKVGAEPLHWTHGMAVHNREGVRGDLPMGGGLSSILSAFSFSTMSIVDQISMGYAMVSASLMSDQQLEKADEMSLLEWFRRHGMTKTAIDHFRPFGAGLTFLELNRVSAKSLIYWIRSVQCKEFFKHPGIGFANGGLGEIYVEPARKYIEQRGGKVLLGKKVTGFDFKGAKVTGIELADGEKLEADIYLSAMPFYDLRRILPEEAFDYQYFRNLHYIDDAPSVSVQIWFDRFVTDMTYIAAQMEGIFNCFADLNRIVPRFAEGADGSMIELVLTPSHHLMALSDERIFHTTLEELRFQVPECAKAEVTKWSVVKKRQGVFAQQPGADKYRPTQRSPLANLYLCGDYTSTSISAGMENACASANLAVERIMEDTQNKQVQLFSKAHYITQTLRKAAFGAAGVGTLLTAGTCLKKVTSRK